MSNMSIYLIHVNLEKRQNGIIQAIGKSAITKREMSRGIVLKKKKKINPYGREEREIPVLW